ncbi:hypothetical protein ALC57_00872 [Trachymyrmex cornetzi]|uniref:Uncharacterized protein n=1 Tax=Trachymyrmex cornetzi TaxID=471704 RepID=A0A195EMV2_9HYME|nr:hypothetical protein ALC57_00872 [Trachymyrmex cornetzi]
MKNDDTTILNILEIKTISPSSSPRDLVINTASEGRASSSTDSSGSSPSDLRRRLEDLPSPNEFTFLADRVAAFGRRICRKREVFLRLHEVANRIEENDEWEEREQRAETESSLRVSRPKDARARRRARVRLESSLRRDDKAMVISQADGSTNPSTITSDGKLNPAESSVNRSVRDDRLRLPAIAISRGKSRPSSLSEPSSTRFSPHSNGESRDIKCKTLSHSHRNFTPRESASKSTDLPSVSPFSLSGSVRPKKFGGYRPPSGIILKNLSSSSESESINETSSGLSSVRKIDHTITTLELSSPESMAVSSVNEPIKKMPIMSARSDITGSILPNLLPSSRSLDIDDFDRRIAQNTSRSYAGQINRDETTTYNQPGKINALVDVFNERASHDGFVAKTSSDFRQVEPEHEGPRYQREETPQDTSIFFTKSFMLEFAEPVPSAYNEQVTHNESTMKVYDEFKRVESEFESIQEKEEAEDYRRITSKTQHDIKNPFEFNCSPGQFNFEAHSLENNRDVLDMAEWHRSTSLYPKAAVDTSHFIERIQNDITEEALSSQTLEPYGSGDHSRSSCTAKMYLQKETLSSRRPQTGIDTPDKCDQEILTKVPTLALNSQDISYSTSAGSRECSAAQPLDPHALIKALSDVSLKQEKQADGASRKREGFHHGKDTIDASSGASDFPTKGETWRVPRSSTLESPRRSLSRIPSRIPVRIPSNKSLSGNDSGCYKPENSNETAIYAESKFIEQNSVPCESIVRQMSSSYSEICKQNSLKSRNESIEVTVAEGAFPPGDEAEYEINDHVLNLASSNLRSLQNTFFGDYTYDQMQHLSAESKFKESCSPAFFHKAAYSSGRDYAKIDDDVRSRSDRSTSRKSIDTADVTSATESPDLSKYKKDKFRIESLRNADENVTWRTEDECASINDEENSENVKDYTSRGKKSEGLYLQDNEQYKLAIGIMCEPLSFKSQYLQLDSPSEIQKSGRKRNHVGDNLEFNDRLSFEQNLEASKNATLENLTFHVCRTQEQSDFAARISPSTLNLNCEPKRKKKKKSQERFPFTISEASGALSVEHEDTNDYQLPDKNLGCTKMDDHLREKTDYQLKMHPSLTRLAISGVEDTVADILCCVAKEKKENTTSSKSMIKAFVRIFSSKLKKASKQPNDDKTLESTKIIYENNACQEESKANSCSDDLSTREVYKTCSNDRWADHHAARSNPMLVSSWETLKKTESLQAIAQKHPHRRFDRDDLWVKDIKYSSFDEKKDSEMLQRKDEADGSEESSAKDRYSIFLAKNLQSNEPSASNHNSLKEQQGVIISGRVVSDEKNKRSIRKVSPNLISEIEDVEDLTGCFCWRLCHIFAPSKYRSPVKSRVSASRTKKSDSLLQKRKK